MSEGCGHGWKPKCRTCVAVMRDEVLRWRTGFAAAEAYFDQVNDVDEASRGENGQRRELIATGAAAYHNHLRRALEPAP